MVLESPEPESEPSRDRPHAFLRTAWQTQNGRTSVDALHLEGAGTIDVSAVYGSRLESVVLQSDDLELAPPVATWSTRTRHLRAGLATVAVRYDQHGVFSPGQA